jgi:hypothetical protein
MADFSILAFDENNMSFIWRGLTHGLSAVADTFVHNPMREFGGESLRKWRVGDDEIFFFDLARWVHELRRQVAIVGEKQEAARPLVQSPDIVEAFWNARGDER